MRTGRQLPRGHTDDSGHAAFATSHVWCVSSELSIAIVGYMCRQPTWA